MLALRWKTDHGSTHTGVRWGLNFTALAVFHSKDLFCGLARNFRWRARRGLTEMHRSIN
jgi:hypothetical protein